ncbi:MULTISPECIES: ASCH domain-containing protein [unclassified Nodularia (in: cyanobacteria)]|uniref:ASCH domain-containing protein n=1 Tax=unclassified Nodularia (in: cyanobacteria) TaxID=2656917 RepID=UPI001882D61C|nr:MULTISPECIES: ASCH domain-containing protein [unclassified Nodularia (in: cyanobacteria)]MBE9199074.1 ASCH domain-containing protein [Nodularia sp. LEGE 06071]MCC2694076.1 ASCH domain-containing protein [Nodularia sp. LEGE 04288]
MKALSLWQPWASAIALGMKSVETRSWGTKYRGYLLICSAQKDTREQELYFYEIIKPIDRRLTYNDFPFGVAVAVVNIKRVVKITEKLITEQSDLEKKLGLWEVGRYAWVFDEIRPITPFEVKGKQGLFDVDY